MLLYKKLLLMTLGTTLVLRILKLVYEYTHTGSTTLSRPRKVAETSTHEKTWMVYTLPFCC